ncbi:hypothetical protein [Planotetraspora phitsanulokensis]|nr:hypothetical protein [Planotetraspora phitsanulokensis]
MRRGGATRSVAAYGLDVSRPSAVSKGPDLAELARTVTCSKADQHG